ncbi:Gfo/Idh/MocA family protein [Occultella gossypii]|uniref:Gfo/Idh/MocA family oxidoreductase n=1 Tax=Occultella gossypii TaxID=2800820 RepID=A0ABS7S3P8_9MICO|nr:Gfo/Idh/MocA family oxidoreductase [Occultella gossypii]MBZ2194969.1 Gfo/Idh/MocA family oxidoreductase [Occultella gossypii]
MALVNGPARIAVVGAGWRAGYALRVARERPDLVEITGVYARSARSAARIEDHWDVRVSTDLDVVIRHGSPEAAFVCVSKDAVGDLAVRIHSAGLPLLLETPPGPDLDALLDVHEALGDSGAQVSEQYQYQPQHAARIAVARTGLLGPVGSASVSVAHDYHAVSLLRLLLGVGFEDVVVDGATEVDRVRSVRGRDGWLPETRVIDSEVVRATLRWASGRLGAYEFGSEQYVSPLRGRHLRVRGVDGELVDDEVARYVEPGRVSRGTLRRDETGRDGDLEGLHLRQVWLGERLLAESRFGPARLSDDEIALGECLVRMGEYVRGGDPFYPLADACEDTYLGLLIHEAVRTGGPVRAAARPWQGRRSVASTEPTR